MRVVLDTNVLISGLLIVIRQRRHANGTKMGELYTK